MGRSCAASGCPPAIRFGCDCMKSTATGTRSQWQANSHRGELIRDRHDGSAAALMARASPWPFRRTPPANPLRNDLARTPSAEAAMPAQEVFAVLGDRHPDAGPADRL